MILCPRTFINPSTPGTMAPAPASLPMRFLIVDASIESEDAAGLVSMHLHGEIPRLPGRLAGYQTILDRLLAKKPEERFQSARELFATIAV